MRSGAQTLVLLATPLNVIILRALAGGPKRQAELRREAGVPAQTTLRAQLKRLLEIGALVKRRRDSFPGTLDYELTVAGREIVLVAAVLERWLQQAPGGPLPLGAGAAKAATKALAEGWSTTMLRALATGPLTLTELDRLLVSLSYPSLERRLAALRLVELIEPRPTEGRGTPHAVTTWLRQGVAPLLAAARWERRHLSATIFGRTEIEAVFLLTVPLLRAPSDASGACRLAAATPDENGQRLSGVTVEMAGGRLVSCATRLRGNPDAWALGSLAAWLDAMVEHDTDGLELGGDCGLVRSLIDGAHACLF
jgi:DNA-binding HxlR family transcriptional regulator